ncbi:DUF2975 domain-containing protein [Novosphingobium huizhouense]|uniref:DUF2975 domain-containing protein n=1 Tax=Novosphingobium huizhouense TaxID=2866625 RepID=UPI001CD85F52|nr:DUF2975 domain-containing protein [Novosphingobium huizhouense]
MNLRPKDPLLAATGTIALIGQGLSAIVAGATLIAAPVIVYARQTVLGGLAGEAHHPLPPATIGALVAILLLVAAMAACAFAFLRHLRRIVASVAHGDPFAPVNAARLAAMGWLTLAVEGLSIPVGGIGQWLATTIEDATSDFGVSVGGVLLALILFILARVFREGARMRDDLEGTV